MKTRTIKKNEIKAKWYLLDAEVIRLGQLARKAAVTLIGKDKVNFSDNLLSGDYVVIINAKKVSIYPKKKESKKYYRHSGYMGSLKVENFQDLLKRKPEQIIENAVKGMLPNNKLRKQMLKRLFVYPASEHKNEAQKPEKLLFNTK